MQKVRFDIGDVFYIPCKVVGIRQDLNDYGPKYKLVPLYGDGSYVSPLAESTFDMIDDADHDFKYAAFEEVEGKEDK